MPLFWLDVHRRRWSDFPDPLVAQNASKQPFLRIHEDMPVWKGTFLHRANRQQCTHSTSIFPALSRDKITEIIKDSCHKTQWLWQTAGLCSVSHPQAHIECPLSCPFWCAAQGGHHCPCSLWVFCSFYNFHITDLIVPACKTVKWEISLFSGFISFFPLWHLGYLSEIWGVFVHRWIVCKQRRIQSKVMEKWGLLRVTWEIVKPGSWEGDRHCVVWRGPKGSIQEGLFWRLRMKLNNMRVWPTCWGRVTGALVVKWGCHSPTLGWAWQ